MEIRIKFRGGPLHNTEGKTQRLEQVKVFFDERQRLASAYTRLYDEEYLYAPDLSGALTEKYDDAKAKFIGPNPSVKFSDEPVEADDDEDDEPELEEDGEYPDYGDDPKEPWQDR